MHGPPIIEFAKLLPFISEIKAAHVANAVIIAIIILIFAYLATRKIRKNDYQLLPLKKFNFQTFGELFVEIFSGFLETTIGHDGIKYLPLIGTLGLFILFSNMSGLIPGMLPPTDNFNTTFGCGVIVFFSTHILGFKAHGTKYLKHFTGPFWWLAWLMIPLEIISHCSRPISLGLRLFGNIMGDHLVLMIFIGLAPLMVPIPIMALGVFVAILQTLVFVLLSISYIAGAVASEH